jgi:general stress protein 26
MNQEDLKQKAIDIISNHKIGVLSSVEENKPHSRYMTFYHEDLTLYSPTQLDTEKINEIEQNPAVSVLLGYEDKGIDDAYLELSGTSSINQSQELKKKFWDDTFNKWFDGPEDPNYALLQIQPEVVRILNNEGGPAQELTM